MSNKERKLIFLPIILLLSGVLVAAFSGCGDNGQNDPSKFSNNRQATGDLSAFEMENGIGPVKEKMELEPLSKPMAMNGLKIFETKCAACHKLDERYVGPAQRDVLERRTPEFVMNMMLNPEENYKKHPEIKKLLAEYLTPMPNQNLSMDEARAVLEYFRYAESEK